jgi:hypothetical protein
MLHCWLSGAWDGVGGQEFVAAQKKEIRRELHPSNIGFTFRRYQHICMLKATREVG